MPKSASVKGARVAQHGTAFPTKGIGRRPLATPEKWEEYPATFPVTLEVHMPSKDADALTFDLEPSQAKALKSLAGNRRVRLSGTVQGGKLVINFVACNAPFLACNAPFTACNAPFAACNAPVSSK